MSAPSEGPASPTAPFAASGALALRRMEDTEEDYRLMSRWLTDDRVLEFYEGRDNRFDIARVKEKYSPRVLGQDRVVPCFILYHGRPIGYLQHYPVTDDEATRLELETIEGVFGMDLFIGEPELWGQGIGTRVVQIAARYLFDILNAARVVVDPRVANTRAVRCYEKCGFARVRLLPKAELHEGEFRDCWLMIAVK